MKLITIIITAAIVLTSASCASAKKVKANKGEQEIEQLCNLTTDETAYFGNGVAESTDMQMAKDKATTAARAEIAEGLKMSIERFSKRFRSDINDEVDQKFEDELQAITVHTLTGSSVVCNRVVKADNGKYRAYVSVKLPKEVVVEAIKEAVKEKAKATLDERQKEFEEAIRQTITKSAE